MPAPNPIKSCAGCADAVVRAALLPAQQCSPCRKKERHRLWRAEHGAEAAERAKAWRDAGNKSVRPPEYAEEHKNRERERYRADPETRAAKKESAAQRRARLGKEVLSAQHREWRAANPDAVAAAAKARRKR